MKLNVCTDTKFKRDAIDLLALDIEYTIFHVDEMSASSDHSINIKLMPHASNRFRWLEEFFERETNLYMYKITEWTLSKRKMALFVCLML